MSRPKQPDQGHNLRITRFGKSLPTNSMPLWIAVRPLNSSASIIFWSRNSSLLAFFSHSRFSTHPHGTSTSVRSFRILGKCLGIYFSRLTGAEGLKENGGYEHTDVECFEVRSARRQIVD